MFIFNRYEICCFSETKQATMKTILLLLFVLGSFGTFSQETLIQGVAIDRTGNPIPGAEVINFKGKHITQCDSLGKFSFNGERGIKYGLVKEDYSLTWFYASESDEPLRVFMDSKIQEIESVVITRKGSEDALDLENVNIIDYQPLQGYILTLKKKKASYYIGIDSISSEGLSVPISITKPRSLYFDCMQNTFILSRDSAYQFVILDGEIEYIAQMAMPTFNSYIRPCVAEFDSSLVLRRYSEHNKKYELTRYQNGEGYTFFSRMDTVGYQVASEDALLLGLKNGNDLFGDSLNDNVLYRRNEMRRIHNGENPDVNLKALESSSNILLERYQTGEDLPTNERLALERQLSYEAYSNSPNSRWEQLQGSYMLRSQPVKLESFQISDYLVTVDFDTDSVLLFDHAGNRLQSKSFIVPSDVKDIWQDRSNGYLFLYTIDHGNHKVYSLNAFTGEVQYLKNFKGVPYTENGLVYDNWLYYRYIENGFYGIKRIQLPEQSFE